MRNLYYTLWVDAIVNSKDFKENSPDWKASVYFLITVSNALNMFVFFLWLDFFNINARQLLLSFESDFALSSALGGFLNFGLPIAIINYFTIFYKKRYLKLIAKYPSSYNGKFALKYVFSSIFIVVITVIVLA